MTRRFRQFDGVSPLGVGVVVALLATCGYAVYQLSPLWSAPDAAVVDASKRRDAEKAVGSFKDATSRHVAQIDGRSLFYLPDAPQVVEDSGPKPTVYGGPSLYAYVNSTAYFSDGQKVSPSEPEDRTLKLVSASPPWSVRVLWEGAEFDVELFKKTDLAALRDTAKSSMSAPPAPSSTSGTSRRSRLEPPTGRPAAPAAVNPIPPGPGAETKTEPTPTEATTAKEATPASSPPSTPTTSPANTPASSPQPTPATPPPSSPPSPAPAEPAPAPSEPAPAPNPPESPER